MADPFRIFIGWDARFPEPAEVLSHSIRRHASIPVQIKYLKLHDLRQRGFNRPVDPRASTEFSFTRFLVPYLCDYEGLALFLDNDMLCAGDIAEIANLSMQDLALRVHKHDQVVNDGELKMSGTAVQYAYPRKNWSSMMLMDCSRLTCWTKEVVETGSGAQLHRFQDIPDEAIGELPLGWNDLEPQFRPGTTKLYHWTEGGYWNDPDWREQRARGNTLPNFACGHLWLTAYDDWRASVL